VSKKGSLKGVGKEEVGGLAKVWGGGADEDRDRPEVGPHSKWE